jgi:hypothetical protein
MTRIIALIATAALGLPGDPVHDPVHAMPGTVITDCNRAGSQDRRSGRAMRAERVIYG